MALAGQLETEMEIKAAAHAFHDVFSRRPHHVSNMAPGHIQSAELHEGDWGQKGSVVYWNYTHDGVPEVAKEIVEEIDDEKNLRTFKVIEGHLLEKYPDFHVTVQATPKGDGSLVRWTIRYVKKNEDTAEPHGIIQLVTNMTKDIDAHLTQNA